MPDCQKHLADYYIVLAAKDYTTVMRVISTVVPVDGTFSVCTSVVTHIMCCQNY